VSRCERDGTFEDPDNSLFGRTRDVEFLVEFHLALFHRSRENRFFPDRLINEKSRPRNRASRIAIVWSQTGHIVGRDDVQGAS